MDSLETACVILILVFAIGSYIAFHILTRDDAL